MSREKFGCHDTGKNDGANPFYRAKGNSPPTHPLPKQKSFNPKHNRAEAEKPNLDYNLQNFIFSFISGFINIIDMPKIKSFKN